LPSMQTIVRRKPDAYYTARAEVFKALGHPTRLRFVQALAEGELCVCHLQELVDADMSTVSKHLSVLRQAGVVQSEKRGNQVYYRLRLPCVGQFMDCIDAMLQEQVSDHLEAVGSALR